jgi:hypothetical protein
LIVAGTPRSNYRFALQPTRSSPGDYDVIKNQAIAVATRAPDRNQTTTTQTAKQAGCRFGHAAQGGQSFIGNHSDMAAGWSPGFLGEDIRSRT